MSQTFPSPDRPPVRQVDSPASPNTWKAWATYSLIAANVVMFAFELASGMQGFGGSNSDLLLSLGADYGPLTSNGQPWRLVTAMFLHWSIIHIGMNMVCLYQVRIVERMMSRAEFVAVYLASGLVGGLASITIHPIAVSAGASGAVFGMFGAFAGVMLVRRDRIDPAAWSRTMRSLGMFFGINLVFGFSQRSIDVSAHVGGLVTGFVCAFVLAKTARPTSSALLRASVVFGVGAAIAFGGLYVLK